MLFAVPSEANLSAAQKSDDLFWDGDNKCSNCGNGERKAEQGSFVRQRKQLGNGAQSLKVRTLPKVQPSECP